MSILIEGMEMPKEDMKNIMIIADGRVFQFSGYGNPKPLGIAVPVPEHGRLGDLDELKERLKEPITMDANRAKRLWEGWHECTIGVQRAIDALPIIIQADKEEIK